MTNIIQTRTRRRPVRELDPCAGHGPYAATEGAPVCQRCGYPAPAPAITHESKHEPTEGETQ